ncbi:T9SS type B sorting domain-containing protein [Fulvivirga lutea]|uniref:Gliding motility-associated C-terminal domain-containing protein n=1 Tax=Fulvivirga lutea TaxID=2810512 RepID=A0A974WF24_9BACT|nr:gliding motility-associated C-terminal domain-containing protein [Fulvivirga lutea]QSE96780.1 gliding motility-associated C-terminal domain-containing protein [Fulvivirga lutea]
MIQAFRKCFFLTFLLISFSAFGQEACNNGVDDDGDGLVDCADGDCQFAATIEKGCNCDDGIDNDGDGNIDNTDSDCASFYGLEFIGDDQSCSALDGGGGGTGAFDFVGPPAESGQNTVDTQSKIAVGDMNCDGIPDVVTTSKWNQSLRIIATSDNQPDGSDRGDVIQDYKTPGKKIFPTGNWFFEQEILIADIDGVCPPEIFTIASKRKNANQAPEEFVLLGFRANPSPSNGDLVPLFDAVSLGPDRPGSLGIADFDCDGDAEIFLKDQIYNAATGELLLDGNIGDWDTEVNGGPVVADIIPGGNLEMVVGNELWSIPALTDGVTQTPTLIADMNTIDPTQQWFPKEIFDNKEYGFDNFSSTSIADVNGDGNLDVVMSGALNSSTGKTAVFFWDITNNTVDHYIVADPIYANGWPFGTSRVNLGDVDGDGKLELSFVAGNQLVVLEESGGILGDDPSDPSGNTDANGHAVKWIRTINDSLSGIISTTVYDFDNDGNPELVYRDSQELVVIDGRDGVTVLWSVTCYSHTFTEGPVIADVDGDSNTDLCVPCNTTNTFDINDPIQQQALGELRCFFSDDNGWLPTRQVWNQQGYAVTNIGDDLSVPCPALDMTTVFSTGDCPNGLPGPQTPLNTFMNQVPTLGADGCPFFPAPDISFVGNDPTLDPSDPDYVDPSDPNYFPAVEVIPPVCGLRGIEVAFNIINSGSLAITDNLDVSFWEGNPTLAVDTLTGEPATLLNTEVLALLGLQVGDTLSQGGITFDYSGRVSTLYIVLNDDGTEFPVDLFNNEFSECFIDNNIFAFPITPTPFTVTIQKISDNTNCDPSVATSNDGELTAVITRDGVTLPLSDFSFQWYDGPDTTSAPLPIAQGGDASTAFQLSNGDYTLVVTDLDKGCSSLPISETIVQLAQTPQASIQVNSNQTVCLPPNGELEVVMADFSGVTFQWFDQFLNPLGITGPVASDLDEGGYNVVVTKNGCDTTLVANIQGPLVPDITASVTQNIVSCADVNTGAVTSEVFLAGVLQDPAQYTFNWYFYDIATSTQGSALPPENGTGPSRTGLAAGDYAVFATQNSTNCTTTFPAIVTITDSRVFPEATVVEVAPQTSCDPAQPNGILEVQINYPGGGPEDPNNFTIRWFRGDNTLDSNEHFDVSADGSQAFNVPGGGVPYTAQVVDVNGCDATDFLAVSESIIYPQLTLTKISDNTICDETLAGTSFNGEIQVSVTYDGVNIPLPDPNYEITWYDGGSIGAPVIAVADPNNPTLSELPGGQQYTAVITRTDIFCPSNAGTVNVLNLSVPPVIDFTMFPSTRCAAPFNGAVTLNTIDGAAVDFGTHTVNWYDGNALKAIPDGTNIGTYFGSGLAPGDQVLLEVIDNATGCSTTQINTITEGQAKPTFTFTTQPNSVCDESLASSLFTGEIVITLDAYPNDPGADGIADTYDYTITSAATGAITQTTAAGVVTFSNLPDDNYTAIVTNNDLDCPSDAVPITVNDIQIPPVIDFTMNPNTRCVAPFNGSVTLNTIDGNPFSPATHTINWYDGNTIDFSGPGGARNPDGTNIETYLGSGIAPGDQVLLEVIDNATGCSTTQLSTITDGQAKPTFTFATQPNSVCDESIATNLFTGEIVITLDPYANDPGVDGNPDTYTYSITGQVTGFTANNNTGVFQNLEDDTYDVVVTNDDLGCPSDVVPVVVSDIQIPPVIDFTMNPNTRCIAPFNGSVTLNTIDGNPFSPATHTINWYDGNTIDFSGPGGTRNPDGTNIETYLGSGIAPGDQVLLEVIDNATGCSTTQLNTITDGQLKPTFTFATQPNSVCNESIATNLFTGEIVITLDPYANDPGVDGIPDTYTYSITGQVTGFTANNNTGVFQNLEDDTYDVVVTNDDLGCLSDVVPVVVSDIQIPPVIDFTMNPNTRCVAPFNGSVTLNTIDGNPFSPATHTINWYDGNTIDFSGPGGTRNPDGTNIVTYLGSGIAPGDQVLLEVIDNASGCSTTQVSTITDAQLKPTFTPSTNPNSVCDATLTVNPFTGEITLTLDANANDPGLDDNYTYDISGPVAQSNSTGVFQNLPNGSYTAIVTNDDLGCASDPVPVVIDFTPSGPAITELLTPSTNCSGSADNGQIEITAIDGNPFDNTTHEINWYNGNSIVFSGGVRNPNLSGTDTYSSIAGDAEYTVEVIDLATGCSSSETYTLPKNQIDPVVTLNTKQNNSICNPSLTNPSVEYNGLITVDVTDTNGDPSHTYTYTWVNVATGNPVLTDFPNAVITPADGTTNSLVSTLDQVPGGTYSVTVLNNILGCESEAKEFTITNVQVLPTPTLNLNQQQTSCGAPNGEIELTAPLGVNFQYEWFVGSGTGTPFVSGTHGTLTSSTIISDLAGNTRFTVRVTDLTTGCRDLAEELVIENLVDPVVAELNKNPNATCDVINLGPTGDFEVQITSGSGPDLTFPTSDYDVLWYTGSTPTGTETRIDGDALTAGSPTLSGLDDGDYTVVIEDQTTFCTSDPLVIEIVDAIVNPTITTGFTQQTSCDYTNNPNGEVTVTVTGPAGPYTVTWFTGSDITGTDITQSSNTGVPVGTPITDDMAGYPAGDYTVLVYNEVTGCTFQETVTITQNIVNPIVSLTPSDHTDCTFDGTITPNLVQGANVNYSFNWYQGQTVGAPGSEVYSATALFGSGDEVLNQTNIQAFGVLNNLYSDFYTLEVIDNENFCTISTSTSFIAPAPAQLDIRFIDVVQPSDCALAEGVLTGYVDLNGSGTADLATEVPNSGDFRFTWYEGLPSDPDPNFFENTIDSYFNGSALNVDVNDIYTNGPVPGGTQDVNYFESVSATDGATIYEQPSGTYTLVVEDLRGVGGTGCIEYASFFLPFVDAQVTTFISKSDDTDCDPAVGNGTIEVIVNEADGTVANQALYPVYLFDVPNPDIVTDPVNPSPVPIQTIQRGGYTSDFSVDVDGWSSTRANITNLLSQNDGLADPRNDVLEIDNTSTTGVHYIELDVVFVPGNNYTINIEYFIPNSNANVDGFRLFSPGAGFFFDGAAGANGVVTNIWDTKSASFTASNESIRIYSMNGVSNNFLASLGNDYLYIAQIEIIDTTIPTTTFSNLGPGDYSIVSQQDFGSGCYSELLQVTIEDAAQPPVLTPTIAHDTWCDNSGNNGDGSISVVPALNPLDIASVDNSPGSPQNTEPNPRTYTYLWNTADGTLAVDGFTQTLLGPNPSTISGLAPGNYQVTVTDDDTGCQTIESYEVIDQDVDPSLAVFNLTPSDRCTPNENGVIEIDANDITPQDGVTPTTSDYSFTLLLLDEITNTYNDVTALSTEVDADPLYRFEDLPAGRYALQIEILDNTFPGFGCVSPPIPAGEIVDNSTDPVLTEAITVDNSCDPSSSGEIHIIADNGAPSAGVYTFNWYLGLDETGTPFNDPTDGTIYSPGDTHPTFGLVGDNESYISDVIHGDYAVEVFDPVTNCFTIRTYEVNYEPLLPSLTVNFESQRACDITIPTAGSIELATVSIDAIDDYEFYLYDNETDLNVGPGNEVALDNDLAGGALFNGLVAGTYYVVGLKVQGATGGLGCATSPVSVVIEDETVQPDISIVPEFDTSCDATNPEGLISITTSTTGGLGDDSNNPVYTYTLTSTNAAATAAITALGGPLTGNGNPTDADNDNVDDDGDDDIIFGLPEALYTIVAENSITGCSVTGQFEITKVEEPIIVQTVDATDMTTCDLTIGGGTATVTSVSPLDVFGAGNTIDDEYSFEWYRGEFGEDFSTAFTNGPFVGVNGADTQTQIELDEGTYYVIATRELGFPPGSGCASPPFRVDILDLSIDPTFTATANSETSCDGSGEGSLVINNIVGTGPLYNITIDEVDGGGALMGNISTNNNYDFGASGAYTETGLGVGFYRTTVFDIGTGCQTIQTREITLSEQPIIITDASATDQTTCDPTINGGTVSINAVTPLTGASIVAEYEIFWYGGALGADFTTASASPAIATDVETVPDLTEGTYYVQVRRRAGFSPGAGCESAPFRVDVFDVSVNPTFTATANSETSCDGSGEGSLVINNIVGTGPLYNITIDEVDGGGALMGNISTNNNYDFGASGAYTETGLGVGFYRTTVFDIGTGCQTIQTREITLSEQPIIITDASATDQTTCDPTINGGTVSINAVTPLTGASIVAEYEIFWYGGALGADFTTASASPAIATDVETVPDLTEGTYYVQVRRRAGFSPGAGCESAPFRVDVFDVSVNPTFTATANSETSCDGSGEGSLVINNIVGTGPLYNITIDEVDGGGALMGNISTNNNYDFGASGAYTETGLGVGFYRTTVFDVGTGCQTIQTREVTLSEQPIIITDASATDQTTCDPTINGGTVSINAVTPLTGASIVAEYEIFWYGGALGADFTTASGGGTIATDVETVPDLTEGTYYVQVRRRAGFSPGAGCESAPFRVDVFDVSVNPTFTASANSETSCDGSGEGSLVINNIVGTGPLYNITIDEVDGGGALMGNISTNNNYDFGFSGPYTETGLGVGFYRTTVFDVGSGCQLVQTREVTFSQQPIIITDAEATDQLTCDPTINGGTVTLNSVTPFGASPDILTEYEIFWYGGALGADFATASGAGTIATDVETVPNLSEGTYYVQVRRRVGFSPGAGCESAPYRLDVFDLSTLPILSYDVPEPDRTCPGATEFYGQVTIDSDVDISLNLADWVFEYDADDDGVFGEVGDDDLPGSYASVVNTIRSATFSGLSAGTYRLTVMDVNGCTNTTDVEIVNDPTASTPNIVDINPDYPDGCDGISGSLEVTSITIGSSGTFGLPDVADPLQFTYEWYFETFDAAGLIAGETTNTLNGLQVGTYYVVVTSVLTQCTSIPKEFEVDDRDIIYPELVLEQTIPQLSCEEPYSGELTATVDEIAGPTGPYTFDWTYEGSAVLPLNVVTGNPVTPEFPAPNVSVLDSLPVGRYDVVVTNTATGCTATQLFIVEDESLFFLPVINTGTEPVTSCDVNNGGIFGIAVPFLDANGIDIYPIRNAGGGPAYNYQIDIYSGDIQGDPNLNDPTFLGDRASQNNVSAGVNVSVGSVQAGLYTVRLIDNNTGCISVKVDEVFVSNTFPQLEIVVENPLVSCDPADPDGQLNVIVDGQPSVSGYTFEWYEGTVATGDPADIIDNKSRLVGVGAGDYTVRVTNNISGCFTDATGTVEEDQLLAPTPTPELLSDRFSCIVEDGELTVTVDGETQGYTFEWYEGEDGTGTVISTNVRVQNLDVGTYSVVAFDNVTGCSSLPASISVGDQRIDPEFVFETEGSKCDEATGLARVVMTNNASVGSITWTDLSNGAGLGLGQEINDVESGEYSALVVTPFGCENEGIAEVGTVITNYNLVSPDGSGTNDNFQIDCITRYPNNNVKIYNRSGVLVYQIDGYNNEDKSFVGLGENGVYGIGNDLPNGTYYYVIDRGDGSKLISGFLELIR